MKSTYKLWMATTLIFLFTGMGCSYGQQKKFSGTFTNGFKGATCTFELSADGKSIKDFTFKGYWRCDGKTELILAGPSKPIAVNKGKFRAIIVEPENGGSTAFRFELDGEIKGKSATGSFRMNINALACDTYKLTWTASSK